MKTHQLYSIDLVKKMPEIREFSGLELEMDMDFFGCPNPMDLNETQAYKYDRKLFRTEEDAESYLKKYVLILKNLDNSKICKSRDLPTMLYKRRYLIQTILGEKNQTVRSYRKKWNNGELFNLYDQTYFLTVQLKQILEKNGEFIYEFKRL